MFLRTDWRNYSAAILISMLLLAASCTTTRNDQASKDKQPPDPNQVAYCTIQKAIEARSFASACVILAEVKMSSITDVDLREYLQYCTNISAYCAMFGIERQSELTLMGVLKDLHWTDLFILLFKRALIGGGVGAVKAGVPGAKIGVVIAVGQEAANLAAEGWKLYRGLDRFYELDDELGEKYGECN